MTCYIPSIEKPDALYTLHVRRFDPATDAVPHWGSYKVPFVRTLTVVEALEYLWDQGTYIAFRANCREFTCGSCAILVNGKPRLACDTLLEDDMHLEPLSRYPVLRDLVVDTRPVRERMRALRLWPEGMDRGAPYSPSTAALEAFRRTYSRCIECYCCLEACPASRSEQSAFPGPMYQLQLARARAHPLDGLNRVGRASAEGLWQCVNCAECREACPLELSPVGEINRLRLRALGAWVWGLLRRSQDGRESGA